LEFRISNVHSNGIHVMSCSINLSLRITIEYDKMDPGYYDSIVQLTLEALQGGQNEMPPFDAILIDEGQDFRDDMFRILLSILRPGGDLLIALDCPRFFLEVGALVTTRSTRETKGQGKGATNQKVNN
jgi:superfamily I DNA and RNA helicase